MQVFLNLVEIAAVPLHPDTFNDSPIGKLPDAHAGIAFADVELIHQILEAKGVGAKIESGKDLPQRSRQAEALRRTSPQIDKLIPNGEVLYVQYELNVENLCILPRTFWCLAAATGGLSYGLKE